LWQAPFGPHGAPASSWKAVDPAVAFDLAEHRLDAVLALAVERSAIVW